MSSSIHVIPMYYWSTEGRDVFEGKKKLGGRESGCRDRTQCDGKHIL